MKPRCEKVVIVEGKYDQIRLLSCLDAQVFTTDGFGIFKDGEKKELFRRIAKEKGIVILSDSDGGGKVIRGHLKTLLGEENVTHLYIPPIRGKEKRKAKPGKEGILGVEGMTSELLVSLFEKAGLLAAGEKKEKRYAKADLYRLGYFGKADAKEKRTKVLQENHLPINLSSNAFLDVVNLLEIVL